MTSCVHCPEPDATSSTGADPCLHEVSLFIAEPFDGLASLELHVSLRLYDELGMMALRWGGLGGKDETAASPELLTEGLGPSFVGSSASSPSNSLRNPLDCDICWCSMTRGCPMGSPGRHQPLP
jgi:hypothetical protein